MGYSTRQRAVFAAIEAAVGTAETLAGTDVVQVQNLRYNPIENLEFQEREIIRSSLQPEQGVYTGALGGLSFDVELKGSGSAGTAPRLGRLLRACGCQETIVASTSVTYTPDSDLDAHDAITLGYRDGDNWRVLTGCRGTFSINMTARKTALISFQFKGHIDSEDEDTAPTASAEATVPPAFIGASFTMASVAYPITALTLDVGNTVEAADDPNQTDGFGEVRVTERNSRGTVNPEAQPIDTKDFIGVLRAGDTEAIATGVIGPDAGNRWAVSFPAAYYREISEEERQGLAAYAIGLGLKESSGDDEFSLQFT